MMLIELERPRRWLEPPRGVSQEGTLTMDYSKTCNKCKQLLPQSFFGKDSKAPDKLRYVCKPCNNQDSLDYYYSNFDKVRSKRALAYRKMMATNPEPYRKACAIRQARFRKANPEKAHEHSANWKSKNPDGPTKATARWRKNNPGKTLELNNNRRARKLAASVYLVTAKDILKIMRRPCAYCGKSAEHLDHVIPLSRGGLHSIGNLAPSCASCNTSKNDKFFTEWRKSWL